MHTFTVKSRSIMEHNTFVPNFYYYSQDVKQHFTENGGEYAILGECATISDGEHSAIPRNKIGSVRYLYGRNIREGVIDYDPISDDSYITENDYETFTRCHIHENDVLIAIYGTVGKSAVYKEEFVGKAGIPRHIANITLKPNAAITPEYLTAFFRSKYGKAQIKSFMTGNIQQLFSLKSIRSYSVPLLPPDIMDQITNVEKEALSSTSKANSLIRQAVDVFYSGIGFNPKDIHPQKSFSINSRSLFESNIWSVSMYNNTYQLVENKMEENTGIVRLGEIVDVSHGDEVGSDAYISYEDRAESDIPFIRTSDIVNNEPDLYPDYYVSPEDSSSIKQTPQVDDILFTKDGKIGSVGMIGKSDVSIYASGLAILRANETARSKGLTPQYIFTALLVPEVGLYGALRRAVVASTIPHLREDRLKEIAIPVLSKDKVTEITDLVRNAFELKAHRKDLLRSSENIIDDFFRN